MGVMTDNYRAHLKAFAQGDIEGALSYMHDDIVWYPNRSMRPVNGKQAVRDFIAKWGKGMSEIGHDIDLIVEHGNHLLIEGVERYVKNGKQIHTHFAGVVEWRDGKAVNWRDYFDLKTLEKQLAG